jgi:Fe-S cluster biogenesis protein NfuA
MPITIYLPTSYAAQAPSDRAVSPSSLAGLRLAVLDNGKPNAGVVMARAAETLAAATSAAVTLVTKKGPGGRSANAAIPCAADIQERLVAEADLIITGSADCGSCTAYSVYDAIELERLGKPAVVVTTTKFLPIAETMAANFGLADTRLLVFPHPLGGTDSGTLHRWAESAVDALVALFTGKESVAVVDDVADLRHDERPRDVVVRDADVTSRIGALDDVRAIVQADGSDLELVGFDAGTGTMSLRLRIDDATCADCIMPAEHLERVAIELLGRTMPDVRRVVIDDPRLT